MKPSQLLNKKSRWCKHNLATDAKGIPKSPLSINARRFCLIGALDRCYRNGFKRTEAERSLAESISILFPGIARWGVSFFNDRPEITFADIKRLLKHTNL